MNPWRSLNGLPKEMWLLAGAVFVNRSGMMVLPFLVLYVNKALAFSPKEAGLVLTCYGIAALATAPIAGKLSDHFRPMFIMRCSLVTSGVLLLLLPLAHSYASIIASVIVWSAVSEAYRPAALAFITDITTLEQRKASFALNRLAINLGMSIGPAVGGFLFVYSYHLLFWVDGLTALGASILLLLPSWRPLLQQHPSAQESWRVTRTSQAVSAYRNPKMIYYALAIIPILIIFFQHESTMPLFIVRDLHLPESVFGLMFTINTALIVLLEVPLNLAVAHRPHHEMLALGAFLIAAGFGAMAFATGFWTLSATVIIWTFGEMIFLPTSATYVSEIAPPNRRGEYMGLFQVVFSLGLSLGAWLGTSAFEFFGATVLWGTLFGVGCFSTAMLWRTKSVEPHVSGMD